MLLPFVEGRVKLGTLSCRNGPGESAGKRGTTAGGRGRVLILEFSRNFLPLLGKQSSDRRVRAFRTTVAAVRNLEHVLKEGNRAPRHTLFPSSHVA